MTRSIVARSIEVRIVFDSDTAGDLAVDRQAQLELRAAAVERHRLPADAVERQPMHGSVGDVEQHLGQRRAVRVAALSDLLHQAVEGDILVREGLEGGHPHAQQQFAEGGVAGEVDAQHQRVDEGADQTLGGALRPVRDRDADRNVGLAG